MITKLTVLTNCFFDGRIYLVVKGNSLREENLRAAREVFFCGSKVFMSFEKGFRSTRSKEENT